MLLWISDGGLSPFFKSLQFPYSSPAAFAQGKKKKANGKLQTSAPARVLLRFINLFRKIKHASPLLPFVWETIIDGREEKAQWCVVYGVTSFLFRALPGGGDPLQVHTSGLQGHQGKKQHYLLLIWPQERHQIWVKINYMQGINVNCSSR